MSKLIILNNDKSISTCKEKNFKYSKKMDTILIPMTMEGLLDGFIPIHANKYMNFTKAEINTQVSKTFEDDDYEEEEIENFPIGEYTTTSLIELYNYLHSFRKLAFANVILSSNLESGNVAQFIIITVDIKLFDNEKCIYEFHYNALEDDESFSVEQLEIYRFIFDYKKGDLLRLNLNTKRWGYTDKQKSGNVNIIYGRLLYYTIIYIFENIESRISYKGTMSLDIFSINYRTKGECGPNKYITDREVFDEYIYNDLEVYDIFPISYMSQSIIFYEIMIYFHYLTIIINIVYNRMGSTELIYQLYSPSSDGCKIYDRGNINNFLMGG